MLGVARSSLGEAEVPLQADGMGLLASTPSGEEDPGGAALLSFWMSRCHSEAYLLLTSEATEDPSIFLGCGV